MKRIPLILTSFTLITMLSCKSDKKQDAEMQDTTSMEDTEETYIVEEKKVQVMLEAKSGSNAKGNAVFTQKGDVVTMVAVLGGLEQGPHAIHIHEKSDCSAEDGTSTGGHWNPTNQPHGKWGDVAGYHKGDIGNLKANDQGNATITMSTDQWCIGCGDPNKDILGRAIIVHQGVDDFKTQPTGDAGGRISCGGIIQ